MYARALAAALGAAVAACRPEYVHVIVDGTDNFSSRYLNNDAAFFAPVAGDTTRLVAMFQTLVADSERAEAELAAPKNKRPAKRRP